MASEDFKDLGLSSIDVANAIRYSASNQGLNVNMTQIHKLLYIAYGSLLVRSKTRLTVEHPSAWPYGPVFPRVHKHVKLFNDITPNSYDNIQEKHPEIATLIDNIVTKFGKLPAGQLSAWSHEKNSPWDLAVQESKGKWNTKLNDEYIFNYFFSFFKFKTQ